MCVNRAGTPQEGRCPRAGENSHMYTAEFPAFIQRHDKWPTLLGAKKYLTSKHKDVRLRSNSHLALSTSCTVKPLPIIVWPEQDNYSGIYNHLLVIMFNIAQKLCAGKDGINMVMFLKKYSEKV